MATKTVHEPSIAVARAELKLAESAESELTPAQTLAIDLHGLLCNRSKWSDDTCGWEFEIEAESDHQWDKYSHAKFLKKAESLLARLPGLNISHTSELLRTLEAVDKEPLSPASDSFQMNYSHSTSSNQSLRDRIR